MRKRKKIKTKLEDIVLPKNPQEWKIKYREPIIIREKKKDRELIVCCKKDRDIQRKLAVELEPYVMPNLIEETYQSIKNRGTHKGMLKIWEYINIAKKNDINNVHYLQLDIKKFYPSIDIDLIKQKLKEVCDNQYLLDLVDVVLNGDLENGYGKGVVIGDGISSWLGNLYLSEADHYFKSIQGIIGYIRYCDDMILISNDKLLLRNIRIGAESYFRENFKLHLSRVKFGRITNTNALDTLGYKLFLNRIAVRKHIKHSLSKAISKNKYKSIPSYLGHCKWAHSKKMINNIIMHNGNYLKEDAEFIELNKFRDF